MTYDELVPWYERAEAALGDRLIDRVARPLRYRVRVSAQARNSVAFDGRPACCASAWCIPICQVQAKYDATVHLAKAEAAGARVLANSVAVQVDVAQDGRASSILIRRPDRSESWLGAHHIVIAAHAIEGPKLLLMSRSERTPDGVANRSGAVGRYLMDHPAQLTRALSPEPIWPRRGHLEVSSIHEMREGAHRRVHGAFMMNVGNLGWEWAGPDLASLSRNQIAAGKSGRELVEAVRSHAAREMTLVALTEQVPDPDNRVLPDYSRLDEIGVPKPRVSFRLDAGNEFLATGAGFEMRGTETV